MYLFGWYFGVLGIILGIFGGGYFMASMKSMAGPAKESFAYLVTASILYVLFGSMMVILGILDLGLNHILWQIIPIIFTVSTIFFIIGSSKMITALKKIKKSMK